MKKNSITAIVGFVMALLCVAARTPVAQAAPTCIINGPANICPGTTNTFGGSSVTEYGQTVLLVTYPDVGFQPITLAEDFHRDLGGNPCSD